MGSSSSVATVMSVETAFFIMMFSINETLFLLVEYRGVASFPLLSHGGNFRLSLSLHKFASGEHRTSQRLLMFLQPVRIRYHN